MPSAKTKFEPKLPAVKEARCRDDPEYRKEHPECAKNNPCMDPEYRKTHPECGKYAESFGADNIKTRPIPLHPPIPYTPVKPPPYIPPVIPANVVPRIPNVPPALPPKLIPFSGRKIPRVNPFEEQDEFKERFKKSVAFTSLDLDDLMDEFKSLNGAARLAHINLEGKPGTPKELAQRAYAQKYLTNIGAQYDIANKKIVFPADMDHGQVMAEMELFIRDTIDKLHGLLPPDFQLDKAKLDQLEIRDRMKAMNKYLLEYDKYIKNPVASSTSKADFLKNYRDVADLQIDAKLNLRQPGPPVGGGPGPSGASPPPSPPGTRPPSPPPDEPDDDGPVLEDQPPDQPPPARALRLRGGGLSDSEEAAHKYIRRMVQPVAIRHLDASIGRDPANRDSIIKDFIEDQFKEYIKPDTLAQINELGKAGKLDAAEEKLMALKHKKALDNVKSTSLNELKDRRDDLARFEREIKSQHDEMLNERNVEQRDIEARAAKKAADDRAAADQAQRKAADQAKRAADQAARRQYDADQAQRNLDEQEKLKTTPKGIRAPQPGRPLPKSSINQGIKNAATRLADARKLAADKAQEAADKLIEDARTARDQAIQNVQDALKARDKFSGNTRSIATPAFDAETPDIPKPRQVVITNGIAADPRAEMKRNLLTQERDDAIAAIRDIDEILKKGSVAGITRVPLTVKEIQDLDKSRATQLKDLQTNAKDISEFNKTASNPIPDSGVDIKTGKPKPVVDSGAGVGFGAGPSSSSSRTSFTPAPPPTDDVRSIRSSLSSSSLRSGSSSVRSSTSSSDSFKSISTSRGPTLLPTSTSTHDIASAPTKFPSAVNTATHGIVDSTMFDFIDISTRGGYVPISSTGRNISGGYKVKSFNPGKYVSNIKMPKFTMPTAKIPNMNLKFDTSAVKGYVAQKIRENLTVENAKNLARATPENVGSAIVGFYAQQAVQEGLDKAWTDKSEGVKFTKSLIAAETGNIVGTAGIYAGKAIFRPAISLTSAAFQGGRAGMQLSAAETAGNFAKMMNMGSFKALSAEIGLNMAKGGVTVGVSLAADELTEFALKKAGVKSNAAIEGVGALAGGSASLIAMAAMDALEGPMGALMLGIQAFTIGYAVWHGAQVDKQNRARAAAEKVKEQKAEEEREKLVALTNNRNKAEQSFYMYYLQNGLDYNKARTAMEADQDETLKLYANSFRQYNPGMPVPDMYLTQDSYIPDPASPEGIAFQATLDEHFTPGGILKASAASNTAGSGNTDGPPDRVTTLFLKAYNHDLTQRQNYDQITANNPPETWMKITPELTEAERRELDDATGGTWEASVNQQVQLTYLSNQMTSQMVRSSQQTILDAWKNGNQTDETLPEEVRELAKLDPNWEQFYTSSIQADAQRQIIQAFNNQNLTLDDIPKNIVDIANTDGTFMQVYERYTNTMTQMAEFYGMTVQQLAGSTSLTDDQRKAMSDKLMEDQMAFLKPYQDSANKYNSELLARISGYGTELPEIVRNLNDQLMLAGRREHVGFSEEELYNFLRMNVPELSDLLPPSGPDFIYDPTKHIPVGPAIGEFGKPIPTGNEDGDVDENREPTYEELQVMYPDKYTQFSDAYKFMHPSASQEIIDKQTELYLKQQYGKNPVPIPGTAGNVPGENQSDYPPESGPMSLATLVEPGTSQLVAPVAPVVAPVYTDPSEVNTKGSKVTPVAPVTKGPKPDQSGYRAEKVQAQKALDPTFVPPGT